MTRKIQRVLLILAVMAVSLGGLGMGSRYWSQGVPGHIDFLFQAVAGLSEKSQEHDEAIELIAAHISELTASLCEFYGEESHPGFCGPPSAPCVDGVCDTENVHPCEIDPTLPGCSDPAPDVPGT